MNASIQEPAALHSHAASNSFGFASKFKLLLRREFWENKGGFFWAPVVAGIVSLVLLIGVIATFEIKVAPTIGDQQIVTDDGTRIQMNGLDLKALSQNMSPADMQQLGGAVDMSLYLASTWPFIVLGFVVFFYCLGSLYDERKDRSVLFWKSLPLSDGATVLSKVVSATVVLPTIAAIAAILTMLGYLAIISLFMLYHGGNPVELLFGAGNPLTVAVNLLAMVPLFAVWSLPTVGWLMLCSAWARRVPFLWATLIPVVATLLLGWITLMDAIDQDSFLWFLQNVSSRALFSGIPGTWMDVVDTSAFENINGPDDLTHALGIGTMYTAFLSAKMWFGALAGAAMIFAAIRLRRWRDEG